MKLAYGDEIKILTPNGGYLCFESALENMNGCSYIRFENEHGEEVAYWVCDEWGEEPEFVMGAIMGCLTSVGAVP